MLARAARPGPPWPPGEPAPAADACTAGVAGNPLTGRAGGARRVIGAVAAGGWGRHGALLAALVLTYAGAAQLSYRLEFAGPVAAIVWLPVGVGVAFLYLGGLRLFPGVLVGDLLANDYSTLPVVSALGQSLGNVLEVVVAVVLIRRLVRRGSPLDTVAGSGSLLLAIGVGTAVSATIGTASLWIGGVLHPGAIPSTWRTWWLGDTAGALVVVPLAVAWCTTARAPVSRRVALEGAVLFPALAILSDLSTRTDRPAVYVVFPLLMWAALRTGLRGATLAVTITVGLTVWNTTHAWDPFASGTLAQGVMETQLFIAVAAVSTLLLAALVSERERFTRELAESRVRIVEVGQRERRRLEQNLHDGAQQRLTWLAADLRHAGALAREHPGRASELFADAEERLRAALDELRDLARGIHPAVLTDLGLAGAIQAMALRSSIAVEVGQLPGARMEDTVETTAYYVVAEAITNAQKHARASRVLVSATVEGRGLRVEVVDDGVGGALPQGSGLQGLRDRVEGVGGRFGLQSPAGRGTRITATIPLEEH